MKPQVLLLIMTMGAARLFASDHGGDGAVMPSYDELVREGFARRMQERSDVYSLLLDGRKMAPKPTQAYYDPSGHYAVFYGFKMVPLYGGDNGGCYAFGYPLDFYRSQMPASLTNVNLDDYRIVVPKRHRSIQEAEGHASVHHDAVTTVQKPLKKADQ